MSKQRKFKIGDKVRFKPDSVSTSRLQLFSSMRKKATGRVFTIAKFTLEGNLIFKETSFIYAPEWFDLVLPKKQQSSSKFISAF